MTEIVLLGEWSLKDDYTLDHGFTGEAEILTTEGSSILKVQIYKRKSINSILWLLKNHVTWKELRGGVKYSPRSIELWSDSKLYLILERKN